MEVYLSLRAAFNKMTSSLLLFLLAFRLLGVTAQMPHTKLPSLLHPERGFVSAVVGANVTLRCLYGGQAARLYWFKQGLGQKPSLISSFYRFTGEGIFYNEFQNDPRFILDTENQENNLKIKNLQLHDSATYYCAGFSNYYLEFDEGITVTVRGSGFSIQASVVQRGSQTISPGQSVTLNCTALTRSCDGEHAISWFRNSNTRHPGLIYTPGGKDHSCKSNADTQTRACVFDLPLTNVTWAHAGTYYCAVSLCGYIAIGNGTELIVEDEPGRPALVCFLSVALALTTIVSVISTFCLYKMNRSNKAQDHQARFSAEPACYQDGEDNLHYAAIRINKTERSRKERRSSNNECVYSGVRQ